MKRSVAEIHWIHPDPAGASRTIAESAYRRSGRIFCGDVLRPARRSLRPIAGALRHRRQPVARGFDPAGVRRLVTSVGQRGFRVAPLTAYDVEDTMQTRIIIEQEALIRSIRIGDMAWETAMVAAFHALSRYPVPKEPGPATENWAIFHRQFHMALLSACGSQWLMELAGLLFDQAERQRILRTKFGPQKSSSATPGASIRRFSRRDLARRQGRGAGAGQPLSHDRRAGRLGAVAHSQGGRRARLNEGA